MKFRGLNEDNAFITTRYELSPQDLWMNFPKNQLFCLLGPNGAGKSTLISCLTGITHVTRGDGKDFACLLYFEMDTGMST